MVSAAKIQQIIELNQFYCEKRNKTRYAIVVSSRLPNIPIQSIVKSLNGMSTTLMSKEFLLQTMSSKLASYEIVLEGELILRNAHMSHTNSYNRRLH